MRKAFTIIELIFVIIVIATIGIAITNGVLPAGIGES